MYFVVLKVDLLLWRLFRFQSDTTIMKEAVVVVVVVAGGGVWGVCCQPVSLPCHLML